MKIKVILEEGIVTDVLRDLAQDSSCEVEIVDINRDQMAAQAPCFSYGVKPYAYDF